MECRICFDNTGELISPCACTGTMKYVHCDCLELSRKRTDLYRCDICLEEFDLRYRLVFLEYIFHLLDLVVITSILVLIPLYVLFRDLSILTILLLFVSIVTIISIMADAKGWTTPAPKRKGKWKVVFETILSYVFLFEAQFIGFLLIEFMLYELAIHSLMFASET